MSSATYHEQMGLNDWVDMFREIYEPLQNNERDFNQVLARLLESIAACSQHVTTRRDERVMGNLPKVFCWFCSVVHKSGANDLDTAMWEKFPGVCPYCLDRRCSCKAFEPRSLATNIKQLEAFRGENARSRPTTLKGWQDLLQKIYPRHPEHYDQRSNFAHLIEELGELAEAYRIRYWYPDNVKNEVADVLTWILGIANFIDQTPGRACDLAHLTFQRYPGCCHTCRLIPCRCLPKEVRDKISEPGPYLTDEAVARVAANLKEQLGIEATLERVHAETLQAIEQRVKFEDISNIQDIVDKLNRTLEQASHAFPSLTPDMETALQRVKSTSSVSGKFKLMLPLIPFLLQYEAELGVSAQSSGPMRTLRNVWQKLAESAGRSGPIELHL